jgi:hypothetical protein
MELFPTGGCGITLRVAHLTSALCSCRLVQDASRFYEYYWLSQKWDSPGREFGHHDWAMACGDFERSVACCATEKVVQIWVVEKRKISGFRTKR